MLVLLTGGTGYIGNAVLTALRSAGHDVTALVRSDQAAAVVSDAGATPLLGDITDVAWLAEQLEMAHAAIHTASPGDETSEDVDRAVARAAVAAFRGTDHPYVHTGGVWVYGNGEDITEDTSFDPPALTAWRPDVESIVVDEPRLHASVVVPAIVYGHGAGIPAAIAGSPRDDIGAMRMIGDGSQHWTTVHVDDLADLYVRVVEQGTPSAYYIGASGRNPTVRELTEAAARAADAGGAVAAENPDATRERLGAAFADALLLDQQASGEKARAELGWKPSGPSLVDELDSGSYTGA